MRVYTDPRCLEHRAPPGYPERPERLRRVLAGLRAAGLEIDDRARGDAVREHARAAVEETHDPRYVERLRAAVRRGDGLIDSADNPLSPGTWDAARAAVETAVAAADAALDENRPVFAAVRPPGHHAERAQAMGFCFLNSVAVAANHLLRHRGLERVAILDVDVHHGNGTQHLFETRADVLFVSLHQYPFYPGTGAASETGRGAGRGATLNLPLPAGTGDDGYARALTGEALPAIERFAPEMLLVSAGFDAWRDDPLGGMRVTAEGFEQWGRRIAGAAARVCGGRVCSLLEGGYDLRRLAELVERYLRGLEHPD